MQTENMQVASRLIIHWAYRSFFLLLLRELKKVIEKQ